ncbi:MAG: DUF1810 domain-containing protein [Clostridia bacterium]
MEYNLQRFLDAQQRYYDIAKYELSQGEKESHYMWFMFPQIKGLGYSFNANYYAINDIDEARLYLQNPILKSHMNEVLDILLDLQCNNAYMIFGTPDDMKLKSSMTLFKIADPSNERFDKILQKFYKGKQDEFTIQILQNQQNDLENSKII